MKLYWHQHNPWADSVVYVPIEELAMCQHGLGETIQIQSTDDTSEYKIYTIDMVLDHWRYHGNQVDAYILPQPSGHHDMGIRFGPDGPNYLSPHPVKDKLQLLLDRYRKQTILYRVIFHRP